MVVIPPKFFAGGTVNEDKAKPLSDDDLVKKLKDDGLNVARRTVTKYRKKMGIPSSRQRRDWSKR